MVAGLSLVNPQRLRLLRCLWGVQQLEWGSGPSPRREDVGFVLGPGGGVSVMSSWGWRPWGKPCGWWEELLFGPQTTLFPLRFRGREERWLHPCCRIHWDCLSSKAPVTRGLELRDLKSPGLKSSSLRRKQRWGRRGFVQGQHSILSAVQGIPSQNPPLCTQSHPLIGILWPDSYVCWVLGAPMCCVQVHVVSFSTVHWPPLLQACCIQHVLWSVSCVHMSLHPTSVLPVR